MTDIEYLKKYYNGNIEEALKRLENGEPIQYIIGNVNFYGNTFVVNNNVLIPRFETEELVEKTIKLIKENFNNKVDILDLCTGSGCIAITLNKELNSNVDAADISNEALDIAIKNNKLNNTNVSFIHSDIFSNIEKKYDVIISNPPYISEDEEIMDIVKNNEPHLALYAKNNGLYFYEEILKKCSNYLKDKYLIAFEIGYLQGEKIKDLAYKYLDIIDVWVEKDLQGKDRFVFIKNK